MRTLHYTELERIFAKVRWEGEHLVWIGAVYQDRYRKLTFRGRIRLGGCVYYVTRLALELYLRREIAPGMQALHTQDCLHPRCIRFEHLYEGTQLENMQDRMALGRWAGGRPRGA